MISASALGEKIVTAPKREDFVTGSIAMAAILIFVGTAGNTLWPSLDYVINAGGGADRVATVALLLNIALLIFALARHRHAQQAMRARGAAEERAHQLTTRDQQTELLNRHSLRDRVSTLIGLARDERANVALLVINLDRFKRVNEIYGDEIGDGLLRIVAGILLGTAPKHALCGRLGSDEFALALPYEEGEEEKVEKVAAEILAQVDLPISVMGVKVSASASIGLSRLAYDCGDFSTLLRRADIAMNAAKQADRMRLTWFDAKMERTLRAQNEVEVGLRRGIPLGEFVPYYQPQIEFGSGEIRGFEMLARWHHPAGGVVGPEVFIHVAEETGLIGELSEKLMRVAFEEARHWDAGLTLSVNISPKQLSDPRLPDRILKLLAETGFPAERLEVEITESSLFEKLEIAQGIAASLKEHGIRLSLDDFGTGYSSLAHLRALPFDRIKIDRSFVLALNKDPDSWAMVQSIAALGKTLGVPVTGEGVESAAIELRVRGLGCELGQGWFYGHAASAAQTRQLLADAAGGHRPHDVAAHSGEDHAPTPSLGHGRATRAA